MGNSKMARSNGSLYNAWMYGPQYAPQGELYDRLGRHAYQPRPEDKSAGDTTSESEDDRRGSSNVDVSNVIVLLVILVTFHCCPNVSNLTRAWHRPNVRTLERSTLASSQCQK